MNRIIIAALLALVAIGAGSVWAIGQFGGSANPVVSEPREPIVREPEIVAAVEPAAQPQTAPVTTPTPAKPKAPKANPTPAPAKPTTPAVEPKAEVTPALVTETAVVPEAPATPTAPAKKSPLDALKARVEKEIDKVKPPTNPAEPSSLAPTTPAAEPQAAPATPAVTPAPAPANPPAVEPKVSVQNAPAPTNKPAVQARVQTSDDNVQVATAPGVTQNAAPVGLEAQFKSRRVTYNRPPAKLALNKAVDVSLVINATADENAGKEALEGFKGEIVERDVDLSDTVSAQLTGAGFDIVTQTVDRQRLSGRTVNRWQWRVTPTEEGEHTLMLEIFGYATGSLDAEPLDAYRDVIAVEVEQLDQIVTWAKGVQPLFAVLAAMAGIGSAIFAFLRFREEKKQTKAGAAKGE